MKIKLKAPPRLSAIDKKTCKEHSVCRYECGHLDKNKDGVRYVLEGAHNGYPAVREPHEVEVYIDLDSDVLSEIFIMVWDAFKEFLKRAKGINK
jgi:hypothetical protein